MGKSRVGAKDSVAFAKDLKVGVDNEDVKVFYVIPCVVSARLFLH